MLDLLSLIVVPAEDVGEVLLVLGIGIPVVFFLSVLADNAYQEGLAALLRSAAIFGILPFLMLGCQALTNTGVN